MNAFEKPSAPPATIRLRHIAQATGLSLGTISKVLNGRAGVSSENREKVQRAVAELGFRRWPQLGAAVKPLGSATVIAYSLAAYGGTFYDTILRAMIDESQRRGVAVDVNLLMLPPSAADVPLTSLFQNGVPEAVILMGVDHLPVLDRVATLDCPTILVNGVDPLMRFDSISPDYFLGGFLATRHLLDLGHRDIVHVGTARRMTLDLRRQGFIAALTQAGISYDPDRHLIDIGLQDFATLDEQKLIAQISQDGKLKGTAFFTVADTVAMSVLQTLSHLGVAVPDDVSVIGFDDLAVSAHCVPPLTTLHSKRTAMGEMAIQMLFDRVANRQKAVARVSVGVDLVARESTAPLRFSR
ncbi:MAG: LacI family DNA-binding transcriptional regulator [Propionivibrio sp.]